MGVLGVTMFDSVDVSQIPRTARAAAGYVGGHWPTYSDGSLRRRCPNARLVSIAVSFTEDAQVLDVERGDATIAQAPAWVRRQHDRGLRHPKVYTSVSQMPALDAALDKAGLVRHRWYHGVLFWRRTYKRWTAHYTGRPHRCTSRCWAGLRGQAGATQWRNAKQDPEGRNLDTSLVGRGWFR